MFLAWATAKLARSVGSLFGLTDAAGGAVAAVVNRVAIWTGFCVWYCGWPVEVIIWLILRDGEW